MAKNKISEYSVTPANNTDINNIDIAEGCSPSGINNAIRELMSDLKDWQTGVEAGQALAVASGGTGAENATNARTNLSAAKSGANSDITSLSGLTTPITVAQGGTGFVAQRTITTVGRATNVVTIATSVAHGYVVNDNITVAAVTNTSVNGTFAIASVPTSTTFTYAQAGTDYANTADTGTTTSSSYLTAANISGIVSVTHGGTGAATLKPNNLFLGNGTSSPTLIPAGSANNVLTSTTTSTVTAGSFAVGTEYTILTVGTTDYTLIGAASSTVGVVFTATGVGSGTGTATTNTWTSAAPPTSMTTTSGTAPYFGARAFVSFSSIGNSNISATYAQSGTTVVLTVASHTYKAGHNIFVDITSGTGVDGLYIVTAVTATTITYTAGTSLTTSGNATIKQCSIFEGSQNVANVVYQATGVFVVNFTTFMPFQNYIAVGSCGSFNLSSQQIGDDNYINFGGSGSLLGLRTIESIRGFSEQPGSGLENSSLISIIIFA
jgi:hypothetical protein